VYVFIPTSYLNQAPLSLTNEYVYGFFLLFIVVSRFSLVPSVCVPCIHTHTHTHTHTDVFA